VTVARLYASTGQQLRHSLVGVVEIRKVAKAGSLQALMVVQKALGMDLAAEGVAHSIPQTPQLKTVPQVVQVL
jgi:hypothetical protein